MIYITPEKQSSEIKRLTTREFAEIIIGHAESLCDFREVFGQESRVAKKRMNLLDRAKRWKNMAFHDFATTGDYELIGFHSYEVEPQYWLTVVEKWRKWFTEQGVGCGDIEEMTRDEYERRYF